ncbi:MAG: amidohydrolase family protein [Anaerolineales bacterium]|jgi:predicted amidohydrolase YtcJ
MENLHRRLLAAVVFSILIISFLLLAGCQPANQGTEETVLPVDNAGALSSEPVSGGSDMLAEVVFDIDHTANGLTLETGGDGDTEVVTVGDSQEQAFRTGSGQWLPAPDENQDTDCSMEFRVDDDVLFEGSPTSNVRIEVEYLDEGTDTFNIQYDAASGGNDSTGLFKESNTVAKSNTGEFKTAVFTLSGAYFGNRQNDADFRIYDRYDGTETIRRVTLFLLPPEEMLSGDGSNLVFYNGVILTMENGETASAIAVSGENILAVGSDEEVIAAAGSGATLVDLEGRTLMPGFVDGHSHWFNAAWRDDFESGQQMLIAYGITATAEMFVEEDLIQDMQAFDREGKLRVRVSLYPVHVDNCGDVRGDWYWPDYPVSHQSGAMLQIPGLKMFNDGGSCNLPARSVEYANGGLGDLYFGADELTGMIVEAQDRGYQVAIHALGDRAVEVNLDAIEAALDGGPNTYRHRIEHSGLVRDELLPRYTEVDPVAMIFGAFPACSFNSGVYPALPDGYQHWEWRWRSLMDANPDVHFAWHSDAPIFGDPWPMMHLHGFVTRKQLNEDGSICEPPDWSVDDVLTVEEALPLMTIESAYSILREDEIGSLKAGKLADLIILSDNPLVIGAQDALLDVQVLMTMVGGKVEYCAGGYQVLCL